MAETTASQEGAAVLSLKLVRERPAGYADLHGMVTSPDTAVELFERIFGLSELAEETLCMVTLDTRHHPIGFWKVATGSINENVVHPREVFKRALLTNAHAVALAHNHPSGDPSFSPQDRRCARRLHKAGNLIGVKVLDFLAVGSDGSHESAAKQGLLSSTADWSA